MCGNRAQMGEREGEGGSLLFVLFFFGAKIIALTSSRSFQKKV